MVKEKNWGVSFRQDKAVVHGRRKMDDGGQNGKSETEMDGDKERERELMSDQRERISHMGSIKLLESRYITSKSKKSKNIYKKTTQIFSNTNIW